MADVALQNLYDTAQRAFSMQGQGNERFASDFIDATNHAINQINSDGDMATRISRVANENAIVTGLDVDYSHVLTAGIWRWLLLMGQKPSRGFERQVEHMASMFEHFISMLQTDLRNNQQDEQGADDDTYDIIGLGALG